MLLDAVFPTCMLPKYSSNNMIKAYCSYFESFDHFCLPAGKPQGGSKWNSTIWAAAEPEPKAGEELMPLRKAGPGMASPAAVRDGGAGVYRMRNFGATANCCSITYIHKM